MILKELRLKLNMRQKDVAEKLGILPTTYSTYETGKRSPDPGMLIKLAQFYGVTVDCLLGVSKSENTKHEQSLQHAKKPQEAQKPYIMQLFESLSEESKKIVIRTMEGFYKLENGMMPNEQELKHAIKNNGEK